MDFSSLNISIQDIKVDLVLKKTKKDKVNFNELFDISVEKPLGKVNKEREPGIKIGTGSFLSVAQYCDKCERTTPHAHKPKERKMRCLICKVDYKY